ncbi:MAG: histidinol-phosphate transaminase, partial [Clostridia bacterium]|nr:histidinol-phosphate transaminase [Clostridia bacterium]
MSRFFSKKFDGLVPYTAGEQPQDCKYVKLNTNESPFPLSDAAKEYANSALCRTNLYPDPDCKELNRAFADIIGVS